MSEFPRYPVIAGTALLAVGVTVLWWTKFNISPLVGDAMIRRGELWRLVTTILPHGGILHLVFNVYWLWVFGTLVEEEYGHFKTALLILLFAIGSSAWEFAILIGGIGLSGVGYGLFGLLWMLSKHDERFHDAVDTRTVQLFVGWFIFCIIGTLTKIFPVANIAHGVGAVLGILVGLAITQKENRAPLIAGTAAIVLFGLWAATLGRPRVNLSGEGGRDEALWGYEALAANKNREAVRWFRDAVTYQPKTPLYWFDLGIAYDRLNDIPSAVASYRRAANQGDSDAQYALATLYESGRQGIPKDSKQALYWYGKLAAQNDPEALNNVAWAYATSSDPAIRNPKAALEYATKAVETDKDHPDPRFLDTLAEALYVNDRAAEAVETEQRATAIATPEEKKDFDVRLQKYRAALQAGTQPASK